MAWELTGALALVVIGLLSLLSQWAAWGLRMPAILPLLLTGIILGPLTGLIQPDHVFGGLLTPLVALAVAVILFEGALTLKWGEIRRQAKVVIHLCSTGMLVSFVCIGLGAYFLMNLSIEIAAVLAAICVVTGPTVIAPLLRVVRPNLELDRILRWEGIVIDPIGAIFAVVVFAFLENLQMQNQVWLLTMWSLVKIVLVGVVIGALGGWLMSLQIKGVIFPPYLLNFAVLVEVLGAFMIADMIGHMLELKGHGSGLLTVTIMGIWLANNDDVDLTDIIRFKEDLSVMLISALFIILAATLDLSALLELGWGAVLLLFLVQFVARPLSIAASTIGSDLTWRERGLLAWIAPRGIVAAAVSALFALDMEKAGVAGADQLVPLVFVVIIGTVVFQSLTSVPIAGWLGVRREAPRGVMIIGATMLPREIARVLQQAGFPVLVVDPVWEHYRLARMEGLPAFYGNAQSEQAETRLDLSGIQLVLALSPNRHQNALEVYYFEHLFSPERVFAIPSEAGKGKTNQESARFKDRQVLFGGDITYTRLSSMLAQGGVLKTTRLNPAFSWEDFNNNWEVVVPLFTISSEGRLMPVQTDYDPAQWGECQLIAMVKGNRKKTS